MTEPLEPSLEKLLRSGGSERLRPGAKAKVRAKIQRHLLRLRVLIGGSVAVALFTLVLLLALFSRTESQEAQPLEPPRAPAALPAPSSDAGTAFAPQEVGEEVQSATPPSPPNLRRDPKAPGRAAAAADPAVESPPRRSTLAEEVALLARARKALEGKDPTAALEALEDHRARFPDGVMRLEREATTWMARCALDRRAHAPEALQFAETHEGMPWVARLRAICTLTN